MFTVAQKYESENYEFIDLVVHCDLKRYRREIGDGDLWEVQNTNGSWENEYTLNGIVSSLYGLGAEPKPFDEIEDMYGDIYADDIKTEDIATYSKARGFGQFVYYAYTAQGESKPSNPYTEGSLEHLGFSDGYSYAFVNQQRTYLRKSHAVLVKCFNVSDRIALLDVPPSTQSSDDLSF